MRCFINVLTQILLAEAPCKVVKSMLTMKEHQSRKIWQAVDCVLNTCSLFCLLIVTFFLDKYCPKTTQEKSLALRKEQRGKTYLLGRGHFRPSFSQVPARIWSGV